jgi:hypothetical protein
MGVTHNNFAARSKIIKIIKYLFYASAVQLPLTYDSRKTLFFLMNVGINKTLDNPGLESVNI